MIYNVTAVPSKTMTDFAIDSELDLGFDDDVWDELSEGEKEFEISKHLQDMPISDQPFWRIDKFELSND